ncbi:gliding motility-associated C-terminal domain-containing protein [Cytophaga aurantiaca]|uniref:T9SS type B sorting domain-containing protein n=1 Tax=Cytophaga aurantiaca TaxID=29530 RepID=UPI000380B4E9|nr:gliding motility-associated C-terminal domain-containing protein [Cytophaga aurantiaca]
MKIKLALIAIVFIFSNIGFAQHETDKRVIGFKYILKFNSNDPDVTINNTNLYNPFNTNYKSIMNTMYANSICDTVGNLLFYYDGATLYEANGQIMNGGNVHEYNFSNHYTSSLIVPIEESNRRYYYLFETLPHEENWNYVLNQPLETTPNCYYPNECSKFWDLCTLEYSIIDMQANNGRGAVTKKNIFVADSVGPSLSGVKHQNNIDTWVTVLKYHTNKIFNYKVNSCSIDAPVISPIPDFEYKNKPLYISYTASYGLGFQCVYSTKGDYVAFPGFKISDNTSTYLFISHFDSQSGLLDFTSLQTIAVPSGFNANLFSHDSRYLYYHDAGFFSSVWTFQYDLNTQTSTPFYFNLDKNVYVGTDYGKENNILIHKFKRVSINPITRNFVGYLGEIKNIDQTFVPSNLVDSLLMPSYEEPQDIPQFSYIARNNYIYNFYHPDYKKPDAFPVAHALSNTVASPSCFNTTVTLKGNTNIPVDSLYWLVKKTGQNTLQRFDADTFDLSVTPGVYTASLVSYNYCLADTATQQFTIEDYPVVHLAEDTVYTCESKPLELPSNTTYTYYWVNENKTTISSPVSETGQYNIVVKNSCGTKEDSLYLKNSTVDVTNLITANNDHQNDCLIAGSNNANEIIRMSIYNSWGSRIFLDEQYKNNWCPSNELTDGVYYYEANYNNNCSKKGWVEIIH